MTDMNIYRLDDGFLTEACSFISEAPEDAVIIDHHVVMVIASNYHRLVKAYNALLVEHGRVIERAEQKIDFTSAIESAWLEKAITQEHK